MSSPVTVTNNSHLPDVMAGLSLLAQYPKTIWTADSPVSWDEKLSLFGAYSLYVMPLKSMNPDRKWEVVSAYQKAIRRGDYAVAEKMVMAIFCQPQFLEYLWRRVMVTAAEDIGPANPELMAWVIACYDVFKPKKLPNMHAQMYVLLILTKWMCESMRSRTYCSMLIIEEKIGSMKGVSPEGEEVQNWELLEELTQWEVEAIDWLGSRPKDPDLTVAAWCRKKGAQVEGLARYYSTCPDLTLREYDWIPEVTTILGLPSYAYDMHTKIGKTMTYKMSGFDVLKMHLAQTQCKDKAKAIGWALFFCEGGRIKDEYFNEQWADLECKIAYNSLGLTIVEGVGLESLILQLIADGSLAAIREKLAKKTYEGIG